MTLPPIPGASAVQRGQIVINPELQLQSAAGARLTTPTQPAPAAPSPIIQARTAAAARQGALAPLLADLTRALETPGLPPQVKTAITQALQVQIPTGSPITAQTIKQAVLGSGLFLEAHLAAGKPPSAAAPDLKAALLVLQSLLAPLAAGKPLTGRPPGAPPPARDGALAGQPAAGSDLPTDGDLPALAQLLQSGVEQALARQTLHQFASLPEGGATTWMFELPIGLPQGAAIAQFQIDRDETAPEATEQDETWTASFSLHLEPLGPVHVRLRLGGEHSAVSIWAEREASAEILRSQGGELSQSLAAEVAVRAGAPDRSLPGPGRFIDEAS